MLKTRKNHFDNATEFELLSQVLYTVYISALQQQQHSHNQNYIPPSFSAVFLSGSIAGAAQSIVAAPMDSLKVRFEVNDLLEGKHRSIYDYAKTTWKELGMTSIYRGFGLTLV